MLSFTILSLIINSSLDSALLSEGTPMISDNDPDTALNQNTKENTTEPRMTELLLYESILPLEPLLFLVEVFNMSEGGIETLFSEVIEPAMKCVLSKKVVNECLHRKESNSENPKHEHNTKTEIIKLLGVFSNFSTKIDAKHGSLTTALQRRNKMFNEDSSQIAMNLYKENLASLVIMVNTLRNEELIRILHVKDVEKKNKKYVKLIKALRRAILETENLTKAMNRELREFVYEFGSKVFVPETKDFVDTKTLFNLGGTIFAPNIFLQMARDIFIVDRDKLLEKAVKKILAPLVKLEQYIRYKSNVEKKEELLKFMNACLLKRNSLFYDEIDEAFKARSMILNLYFKNEEMNLTEPLLEQIDKYQEKFAGRIKGKVSKMKEDVLARFLVVNDDVIKGYTDFIRNGTKENESRLLKIFANKL